MKKSTDWLFNFFPLCKLIQNRIGIFIILFSSVHSHAGTFIGNGGDAIVCRDPITQEVLSAELLDFYEARVRYGLKLDLGPTDLPVQRKIEKVLKRMAYSPKRAEKYKNWALSFDSESSYITDIELVDIPDGGAIGFPSKCKIEQLAIQVRPLLLQTKRYIISKDIWDLLDADNQAGLILHEVIYREGIENDAVNSIAVRQFNALLVSDAVSQLSYKAYLQYLQFLPTYKTDIPIIFGKHYNIDSFNFWYLLQSSNWPLWETEIPKSVSGTEYVTTKTKDILDGFFSEFNVKSQAYYSENGEEIVNIQYYSDGWPSHISMHFYSPNEFQSYYYFSWKLHDLKCNAESGFVAKFSEGHVIEALECR